MAYRDQLKLCLPIISSALFLFFGVQAKAVDWGPPLPPPGLHLEPVSSDREQLECRFTENQLSLLEKLNRCERAVLTKLDFIVVPEFWYVDETYYSPLRVASQIDVDAGVEMRFERIL
jgi:hypothetical protein